jgi:RNA polymerase sigma-70 factor (ECF subfamily)
MTEAGENRATSLTLLGRLRANEPDAWTRMVGLYRPLIIYWCGRGGVTGADADDLCQDVFRAAAAGLHGFRRERPDDSFRGWLRGITRYKLLDHRRAMANRPMAVGGSSVQLRLGEVPDDWPPADDDPDDPNEEVTALLHRALDLVKGEFEAGTWRAFLATAVDGQPAAVAAASLGLTAAAVRQAKSRVLRRIRQELGELDN